MPVPSPPARSSIGVAIANNGISTTVDAGIRNAADVTARTGDVRVTAQSAAEAPIVGSLTSALTAAQKATAIGYVTATAAARGSGRSDPRRRDQPPP